MRRRAVGRDAALTARMAVALVLLVGLYAMTGFAVASIFVWRPAWRLDAAALLALAVALLAWRYRGLDSLALRSVGARAPEPGEEARAHETLERLARLADVPTPRLAICDAETANAFTVGLTRRSTVVVVTSGLSRAVEPAKLEAVLARELAHVVNRDSAVLTAVGFPRAFGATLIADVGIVWPLGVPFFALGALLTLTMSRYREYAADRGAALLTGAPAPLMSALRKLSGEGAPAGDLRLSRAVEAFCIVPARPSRFELLMDHPPLEKRLEALAEIAREMGKLA